MAQLYIANPSTARVEYRLNGGAIQAGRPMRPGAPPWFSVAATCRRPDLGVAGYGVNTFTATFSDETTDGFPFAFALDRGAYSTDDDLIAYAFRGPLLLMTAGGTEQAPNPLLIPPTTQVAGSTDPSISPKGEPMSDTANVTSKVTVFNCYNEQISKLSVGGYSAGDIKPWSDGSSGNPPKYTPSSIAVPRTKNSDDNNPTFAIGDNQVIVPWDSFKGTLTVTIPDPKSTDVSLDDDLMLFITRNNAILVTQRGYEKGSFPVSLQSAAGDRVE